MFLKEDAMRANVSLLGCLGVLVGASLVQAQGPRAWGFRPPVFGPPVPVRPFLAPPIPGVVVAPSIRPSIAPGYVRTPSVGLVVAAPYLMPPVAPVPPAVGLYRSSAVVVGPGPVVVAGFSGLPSGRATPYAGIQQGVDPRYQAARPAAAGSGASGSGSDLRPGMVLPDGAVVVSVGPTTGAGSQQPTPANPSASQATSRPAAAGPTTAAEIQSQTEPGTPEAQSILEPETLPAPQPADPTDSAASAASTNTQRF
jgi:hypothetical protein